MEPQQFDPSTAAPLEEVRLGGLDAYAGFHEAVTHPEALERWLYDEVPPANRDEVHEIASSLPPPVPSLPLWVVAALARHALDGALEWFYTMAPHGVSAPDEQSQASLPLRQWLARHQPQLEYLRLEPSLDSEPWRSWRSGDQPGGHVDVELLRRHVSLAIDEAGNDWWPGAAFVLLRDWYLDLAPLLDALSLPADRAVLDARVWLDSPEARYAIPADSKIALRAPARLERLQEQAEAAVARYTERLGRPPAALRPDSAWGMLLAFGDPGPGPPALAEALADEERVLAALRAAPATPATGQPGYRPSATVTRDYWTTEDTLGYGIYADAIAEFVWHEDTRPPLTIGIKAAWGAGKTSLMRMVRERLDPGANAGTPAPVRLRVPPRKVRVTNRTALRHTAPERAGTEPEPAFEPPAEEDDGRERATVWFNPWTYQSGEHLWAGLAQAIIDGVTGRMNSRGRERFWFELNLARVDRARVRQRIYRLLGRTLVAVAVPGLVLLLGGLALLAVAPAQLAAGVSLAGLVWTVSAATVRAGRFLGASVQGTAGELVRQPDYEASAGALHLVQADVRRVLDLVATPRRPLVVFVDDLDRCSADVVGEVIEALNLFLAGQYPNCIFVLALEPDVVAAHLEAGRADLLKVLAEHLPAGTHFGMGWRFLDKMVQLPLRLPAPEPAQLGGYIDSVLGATRAEHRLDAATVQRRAERLRAELSSIDDVRAAAAVVERAEHGGGDAAERTPLDEETIRAAEEAVADRLRDDAPEVREVIGAYADLLTRNPRDVKRFVNLFRFYAFVQVRRQLRDLPAPSLAQVGKMAILAIRWPYLLSVLSLAVPADRETRVLGALELAAARDDGAWAEAVVDAGLRERMQDLIAADADLRRVLAGNPPLADVIGFL